MYSSNVICAPLRSFRIMYYRCCLLVLGAVTLICTGPTMVVSNAKIYQPLFDNESVIANDIGGMFSRSVFL